MILKENEKFLATFVVSKEVYEGFIKVFSDRNPLHTDDQFAKEKGFKEKVMHGNILNGFLSYFIGECLPEKNLIIHSQEIQFKNPVYLDEVLYFEAVVQRIYESVNSAEFSFSFRNKESTIVSKGKIQIGFLL